MDQYGPEKHIVSEEALCSRLGDQLCVGTSRWRRYSGAVGYHKEEVPEDAVMAPAPLPPFSTVARISDPGYFGFLNRFFKYIHIII